MKPCPIFIWLGTHCVGVVCLCCWICATSGVWAQTGSSTGVSGVVQDSLTREPLAFATVVLLDAANRQLVKGGQCDQQGVFVLASVPVGRYLLQCSFVGYASCTRPIEIAPGLGLLSLPPLRLVEDSNMLQEVVVLAEANTFTMQADKKIFDATKLEGVASGTALDVLKQVPLLDVDADDNMQMRGRNVTVTVDGKPSPFPDVQTTVQMLPADAIERVEVITNPSARYQSEGQGGIVNIVLKKNRVKGYNGALSTSVAPGNQYRAGLNLNVRQGKFNYFATLSGGYRYRLSDMDNQRWNTRGDTVYEWVQQCAHADTHTPSGVAKAGVDYFINADHSLMLSQMVSLSETETNTGILLDYFNVYQSRPMHRYRYGAKENENDNKSRNYITDINYRWVLDHEKEHEFSVDARFAREGADRSSMYLTVLTKIKDSTEVPERERVQKREGDVAQNRALLKADYVHPLGTTGKVELGVSNTSIWNATNYQAEQSYHYADSLNFVPDPAQTEVYDYSEHIYATYADWADTWGKLGYKLGVRLEGSHMEGAVCPPLDTAVLNISKNYWYVFPSAFFTYNLPASQRVVASYSARILRPAFTQLVPYVDISNLQNIRVGNPRLDPSYTHSVELSYSRYFKKSRNSLNLDAYYTQTNDVIQRVTMIDSVTHYVPAALPEQVNVSRSENVGRNRSVGATLILRYKKIKKLTLTTTLNGAYESMQGKMVVNKQTAGYHRALWTGSVFGVVAYQLPWSVRVAVSGKYYAPVVTAQGKSQTFGSIDCSLNRSFFNKKMSVSVAAYDVLQTMGWYTFAQSGGFEGKSWRSINSRQVRLSIMYRFGKMDTEAQERRTRRMVEHDRERGNIEERDR